MSENDELVNRTEDAQTRELLESLRAEVRAPASLKAAVMREISAPTPSLWTRIASWWMEPRAVRVRPAHAALAVAAVAALLLLAPGSDLGPSGSAEGEATQIVTRFVLVAPGAASVRLTGDFAEWSTEGIELRDLRGTGIWTTDVPLPPGVYQYTFIVNDNEWRPDPTAVSQVDDGFGRTNSVVIVSEGSV